MTTCPKNLSKTTCPQPICITNYVLKRVWQMFWENMDAWEQMDLKENERKVLYAIRAIFENTDNIEIFNKSLFIFI